MHLVWPVGVSIFRDDLTVEEDLIYHRRVSGRSFTHSASTTRGICNGYEVKGLPLYANPLGIPTRVVVHPYSDRQHH